ncbi:MAG: hypothetical protein R3264_10885, partial [Anaerolineae bacterium]|nr:hypothetical protein [Anaerolineae bacterium]
SWYEILWREHHYTEDEEYAGRLVKLVTGPKLSRADKAALEAAGRPFASQVETAIRHRCRTRPRATYGWDRRLRQLEQARKRATARPAEAVAALCRQFRDPFWPERFVARHRLVDWGGEAIPALKDFTVAYVDSTNQTATWLLESIAFETEQRLAAQAHQLVCPTCMSLCDRVNVPIEAGVTITYYGCRACGQSRTFREKRWEIVAVLDAGMAEPRLEQESQIRESWLARRTLFDFDRVEIIAASDEDVERFAVQVGNDLDNHRSPRYEQMVCQVAAEAKLSKNTLRILERTFARVTIST